MLGADAERGARRDQQPEPRNGRDEPVHERPRAGKVLEVVGDDQLVAVGHDIGQRVLGSLTSEQVDAECGCDPLRELIGIGEDGGIHETR